jgi:DNA ligase (NAD+)
MQTQTATWTPIPQAQRVYFTPPTECPSCKGVLTRDGEYLVCRSLECDAQASGAIKRWVAKIGVLHVGDSLIEALIEAGFVEDAADLYMLDPVKVADLEIGGRRVGGTGDKAINNLNAKKTMNLSTFVGSLGIPLIGRSMAKTIEDAGYDTLSKMAKAKIADVASIPGVGSTKAEAFVLGFQAKMGLMAKLIGDAGIVISVVTGPLVGKVFAFTGFRDQALQAALEAAGATVKDSVSKATTHLVALDKNGNSTKLAAARKNGTLVIDKDDAKILAGI